MEDEYEYACQEVTPDGKVYPANIYGGIRYQWVSTLERAKDIRKNLEFDLMEEESDSTIRVVRRKKAGEMEAVEDD